jgi:uncharacterized protein DUF3485
MIRVNELQVGGAESPSLVWYWYLTGDTPATHPVLVKFRQALDLLLLRRRESSAYVLHTPIDEDLDASRERLARVARELADPQTIDARGSVSWAVR